jgi:hypothetical protein
MLQLLHPQNLKLLRNQSSPLNSLYSSQLLNLRQQKLLRKHLRKRYLQKHQLNQLQVPASSGNMEDAQSPQQPPAQPAPAPANAPKAEIYGEEAASLMGVFNSDVPSNIPLNKLEEQNDDDDTDNDLGLDIVPY